MRRQSMERAETEKSIGVLKLMGDLRTVKNSVLQEHRMQRMRQLIQLKRDLLPNFDIFNG